MHVTGEQVSSSVWLTWPMPSIFSRALHGVGVQYIEAQLTFTKLDTELVDN